MKQDQPSFFTLKDSQAGRTVVQQLITACHVSMRQAISVLTRVFFLPDYP